MISEMIFKPGKFYYITSPSGHTNRYRAIKVSRAKHCLLASTDSADFYLSYWLNESYKIEEEQLVFKFEYKE